MPLAAESAILDVALAGDRLVAVGERGHIVLSDDYGKTWRQMPCPTRTPLTAVYFPDSRNGWAVGHENVILRTTDGGESWIRQYPTGGIEERYLDVYFNDLERGFAIGAYGFARATENGGKIWEPLDVFEEELHLNKVSVGPDGRLYIAVEAGELLTSGDSGANWKSLPTPYEGSLFGILPLGPRTLLTYGLRGHVFRSLDGGETWESIETGSVVLIMDGIRHSTGAIVLAGQSGQFLISNDGGRSFREWEVPVQGAAALVECPDGAIIAVGLNGVHRLFLPGIQPKEAAG
jgi:photosystem II stability/assembly factor-like uncharacterized protein